MQYNNANFPGIGCHWARSNRFCIDWKSFSNLFLQGMRCNLGAPRAKADLWNSHTNKKGYWGHCRAPYKHRHTPATHLRPSVYTPCSLQCSFAQGMTIVDSAGRTRASWSWAWTARCVRETCPWVGCWVLARSTHSTHIKHMGARFMSQCAGHWQSPRAARVLSVINLHLFLST